MVEDKGRAHGFATGPSQAEPEVSALRASVPCASEWSPINDLEKIADETFERWDKDMRSGKLMLALSGDLPRYRPDVTNVRLACAVAPGLLSVNRAAAIVARGDGAFGVYCTPESRLKTIADMLSDDELGRMFYEMPAQAIEAGSDETRSGSAEGESAAPKGCVQ